MKKVFMIGNAHLDPVWMWRWTEGYAEVKATVRSALDRMREFPDFTFTCASASIYEWLGECAPEMLEEVKERVAEGRWKLAGGWWVQPDCNLPSGESFVRQGLYGQRLFHRLLGKTAHTGYNVDSFGHNAMLPQILRGSGMDAYVFMRPGQHEKRLDFNLFEWESPDGSRVKAFRIPVAYCCNFKTKEELRERIKVSAENVANVSDAAMCFYGVGNHGGGPTVTNIKFAKELMAEGEYEIVFGSPDEFFAEVSARGEKLSVLKDDLQHHASGCYAAVSEIKRLNRECESRLTAAEAFSVGAKLLAGTPYPTDEFSRAWKNTLFNQFHDSLGGCSVRDVYTDAREFAGEALSVAARAENRALQTLSWRIGTEGKGLPLALFNPCPWEVTREVTVNKKLTGVTAPDGSAVAVQHVKSQAQSCQGRDDTLFRAVIPPLGWTVYRSTDEKTDFESPVKAYRVSDREYALENGVLRASFEVYTGCVKSLKLRDRECLSAPGGLPLVIDEYAHDTWSHGKNFFDREIGRFGDAELTVVESGPVRATVKVTQRYGRSTLVTYYSLTEGVERLDARCELDWHEKHKLLKLCWPTVTGGGDAYYEIPFGYIARPRDGEEEPGQRWVAVRGGALLNDSKYSFSVKDGELRMTAVRSPIYGDHGNTRSSESEFTDQGPQSFRYAFLPFEGEPDFAALTRAGAEFNNSPRVIIENSHAGSLPVLGSFASSDAENVLISAFKEAEDGGGLILRAYECAGRPAETTLRLPFAGFEFKASFRPFEVKTLRIADGSAREVMLTEFDL